MWKESLPVSSLWNGSGKAVLCLCTINILNANVYLNSEISIKYATSPVLIPESNQGRSGYYMRVLVQMTQDYLSLAIILTSGKHDRKLPWPFNRNVIFSVINKDGGMNRERGFKCYGNGLKFR